MLDSISIKNFQSLYDIEVPLSPFTVLVGPSSSGKSAFIRACRLLLQNQRGSSFISHGEDTTEVAAGFKDGSTLSIERGKRNQYVLDTEGQETAIFTKLGGDVPDEVKNFLGLDPATSIASQFDPPFLLTASGSEVARTLGSLTNVDTVLSAGREANRLKLQSSAMSRAHEEMLTALKDDLAARQDGLEERKYAVEDAEDALLVAETLAEMTESAEQLLAKIQKRLKEFKEIVVPVIPETEELFRSARAAVSVYEAATSLLSSAAARAAALEEAAVDFVPDVDTKSARAAVASATEAAGLLKRLKTAAREMKEATSLQESYSADVAHWAEKRLEVLQEAGTCPMCGQDTVHLH